MSAVAIGFYPALSMLALAAFIPLTATSYWVWRRRVGKRRKLDQLRRMGEDPGHYTGQFKWESRAAHFAVTVVFTTLVAMLGLLALYSPFGYEMFRGMPLLNLSLAAPGPDSSTHAAGALHFYSYAFLGAYVWGLQDILRRYFHNDLVPGTYYSLGVRMIFSALVALLVYHGLRSSAVLTGLLGLDKVDSGMYPLLAFLIGMFPQRMLRYLTEKFSFFARPERNAAAVLPLDSVPGISLADKVRLAEAGVDSTHDLASRELVPLVIHTPYDAGTLIDWMLQAKLVARFPGHLDTLRAQGLHGIDDLRGLDDEELVKLASESGLTITGLKRARTNADTDPGVRRLLDYRARLQGSVGAPAVDREAPDRTEISPAETAPEPGARYPRVGGSGRPRPPA